MALAKFGYCRILGADESLFGTEKSNLNSADYFSFYDKTAEIVRSGAKSRRPAQPTLEELKIMGVKV